VCIRGKPTTFGDKRLITLKRDASNKFSVEMDVA
jgi:hypothetical protein